MRAPVRSECCVAVPGIAECEGELLSCRLCRKPALTEQGGELAGCGWRGTVLPAEGSIILVCCRGTQAGQRGKWVLSCHRPQQDLGWQLSGAWQISTQSPLRPGLRLAKPRASFGVRVIKTAVRIVMVMGPWRRTPSALYSLVRLLEKLFDCPAQRLFVFSLTVPPPPPPVSSTSSFSVSG